MSTIQCIVLVAKSCDVFGFEYVGAGNPRVGGNCEVNSRNESYGYKQTIFPLRKTLDRGFQCFKRNTRSTFKNLLPSDHS